MIVLDNILILDLDGVLITTPSWKRDEILDDGYSAFNHKCVETLNSILDETGFKIVLISARRLNVNIDQMNKYFRDRGVKEEIIAYVPNYNVSSRKEEIERFLSDYKPKNYLIIDDDRSLYDLKNINWIKTDPLIGLKK